MKPQLKEDGHPKFITEEQWLNFYMAMDVVDGKPDATVPRVVSYLTTRGMIFTGTHGTIPRHVEVDGAFMHMSFYLSKHGYTFKRDYETESKGTD